MKREREGEEFADSLIGNDKYSDFLPASVIYDLDSGGKTNVIGINNKNFLQRGHTRKQNGDLLLFL